MRTLKNYDELDATEKQLFIQLCFETGVPPDRIAGAASCVGELWEVKAFLMRFPKGTAQHEQLASRLWCGNALNESILGCIERIAPDYVSLAWRSDAELDELLSSVKIVATIL